MATVRLDQEDPWLRQFQARVVGVERLGDRPAVELDRSAFYPESGGQMADRGQLGEVPVVDVQLVAGKLLHALDGPAPEAGATLLGTVDGPRRREHMALHTGQHILSRTLVDEAGADTTSSRLGESTCTIDVDRDHVDDGELARALDLANSIVDDDCDVRAFYPSEGELAAMTLRREAKVEGPIRVVTIGDYDVTPCGGTHCTRSGQVGLIEITGIERHKKRLRITFVAGPRARRQLGQEAATLRSLAKTLSCGPDDVAGVYDKLRGDAKRARRDLDDARLLLAESLAESLASQGERVVGALPVDPATLREVAKRLGSLPGRAVFLAATSPEGTHVIVARGAGSELDCGAALKALANETGGRGGGRPERAEGRLPPDLDFPALVAALRV